MTTELDLSKVYCEAYERQQELVKNMGLHVSQQVYNLETRIAKLEVRYTEVWNEFIGFVREEKLLRIRPWWKRLIGIK